MSDLPKSEAGAGPGAEEARDIVLLRRLVTALAAVMAIGMVIIIGLMVARLTQTPALPLPEAISLPEGERAAAVTVAKDWFLVVTETGEVLIYDRETAGLKQRIKPE